MKVATAGRPAAHRPRRGHFAGDRAAVFRTPKGAAGSAQGASAGERVIFRVAEITVPPIDVATPEGKRLDDAVRGALSNELLEQYINYIQRELGININTDALRRVVGGESF